MEDLVKMLETLTMKTIQRNIKQFIHSADGYPDRLKLSLVLMEMLREGTDLLGSLDKKDFISAIQKDAVEKIKQARTKYDEFYTHIEQNKKTVGLLTDETDSEISQKQEEITRLLSEYDEILKPLVEKREKLPIQEQMKVEKK